MPAVQQDLARHIEKAGETGICIQKSAAVRRAEGHREGAVMEGFGEAFLGGGTLHGFRMEALVGGEQVRGAEGHQGVQLGHALVGDAGELPFLGEGICHLDDLDVVEGFPQDQELVGIGRDGGEGAPRIIRIGTADDNLKIWRFFPDAGDGLDAIPPGRHADIDKGDGVGHSLAGGGADFFQPLLSLIGGVQLERGALTDFRSRGVTENIGVEVAEFVIKGGVLGPEDFQEIRMDRRIVIHDENPGIGVGKFLGMTVHAADGGGVG